MIKVSTEKGKSKKKKKNRAHTEKMKITEGSTNMSNLLQCCSPLSQAEFYVSVNESMLKWTILC